MSEFEGSNVQSTWVLVEFSALPKINADRVIAASCSTTSGTFQLVTDFIGLTYAPISNGWMGSIESLLSSHGGSAIEQWEDVRPYWLRIAESDVASLPVQRIQDLVVEISLLLSEGAYDDINQGLRSAALGNLSQDAMVAILRTTFAARALLTGWLDFLMRCEQTLTKRGIGHASLSRLRVVASR